MAASDPSKDFAPIQNDYQFFVEHSTEQDTDLDGHARRLEGIAHRIHDRPIRLLDFGCGPGEFLSSLLDRLEWPSSRLEIALVEPTVPYRKQAEQRLNSRSNRPIPAWSSLPEDAGPFDAVLANHVLYYVPTLDKTLDRIVGALEANGQFLISISGHSNPLIQFWDYAFGLLGREVPYYVAEDLEEALTRLGLPHDREEVTFDIKFPNQTEARMAIIRFLLGQHLAEFPLDPLLAWFDPYSRQNEIQMPGTAIHFAVRPRTT